MSDNTSMNNSNELVKADAFDYAIQPDNNTNKDLDILSGSKYLPRIQLVDSNSKLCKEKGAKVGSYVFVRGDMFDDLTNSFDAIVFARRAKAVRMGPAGIFSFYDPKHPEFNKIIDESETRDSGCFYGPEFLLWVKSLKSWCTLLCASKTARRGSVDINTIITKFDKSRQLKKAWQALHDAKVPHSDPKWQDLLAEGVRPGEEPKIYNPFATFKSSLKRKANYSWYGMDVTSCSTPFGVSPPGDEIQEQVNRFNNPPKQEVETAEETKSTKRAR